MEREIKPRGGKREGSGRKKHKPEDAQRAMVETLSGYGIRMTEIASLMGIDEKTVRLYYEEDLLKGRAKANMLVAQTLYHKATKERDTSSLIFWAKVHMDWSERTKHEHFGPNGAPLFPTTLKVVFGDTNAEDETNGLDN